MSGDNSPSSRQIATGAVAGFVAGLAASFVMDRFQALTAPSTGGEGEPATQRAADAIAQVATGAPLSDDAKPTGGQFVHYGLGAALGIGYGIAAEFYPQVTVGGGAAFATGTWALFDEAAVPAAGLGNPPWKSSPTTQAYGLASHIVFGLVADMTRRLARRVIAGRADKSGPHPQAFVRTTRTI